MQVTQTKIKVVSVKTVFIINYCICTPRKLSMPRFKFWDPHSATNEVWSYTSLVNGVKIVIFFVWAMLYALSIGIVS